MWQSGTTKSNNKPAHYAITRSEFGSEKVVAAIKAYGASEWMLEDWSRTGKSWFKEVGPFPTVDAAKAAFELMRGE